MMIKKRFFIDKIDSNQYAIYDRLKIGYIKPLVYTDRTVGLDFTQGVCDLFNDCDEKMNEVYEKLIIGKGSSEVIDMIKFGDNLYGVTIKELFDKNKKLEEDIDNEKNDYRELFSNYICLQEKNVKLIKENEQLREELSECEKFRYSVFKRIEKTIEDKDNCVLNKDAKSPCKDYDECSKRQCTNKPLPCVVNWMMGRPFENMKKEANR